MSTPFVMKAATVRPLHAARLDDGDIPPVAFRPGARRGAIPSAATAEISAVIRDIAARKPATAAGTDKHALLQATLDSLASQIALLDRRGTIVAANAAWQRQMGAPAPAGTGYHQWLARVLGDGVAAQAGAGIDAVLGDKRPDYHIECRRAGAPVPQWIRLRARRLGAPGPVHVVVVLEDISEIRQAADALRDLTAQLLRAHDDERRRIARDLHDSTCQNLLVAAMTLDQIAPHVREKGAGLVGEARAVLERCMRELRTLSYLLHPPLLEECGLASALREFLNGFSRRSAIAVELILDADMARLPPDIENVLFRIVQESLTNVHRHSGSAMARVRLTCANGRVALNVCDRGHGMAPSSAIDGTGPAAIGVGIAGMRARLHQLGGRLAIRSGRRGTIVRAVIPLGRDPHSLHARRQIAETPAARAQPASAP